MRTSTPRRPRTLARQSAGSSFDQYLLDIRKLPMITDQKEEIRLAKRAQKGDPDRKSVV